MKYFLFLFGLFMIGGVGCVQTQVELDEALDLEAIQEMTITEEELKIDEHFELSKHTTYFATSEDGITWNLRKKPIAHYASVPDLVVVQTQLGPFPEGTLLTYFVDGTQDHDAEDLGLGLVYSLNGGETWSDRLYTSMEGAPENSVVVDPSLVVLPDGTVRLYYYDFPNSPFMPGFEGVSAQANEFHTATSIDGVHFVYEGLVYSTSNIVTDPDLISFQGAWYMYFMSHSDGSMVVSVSENPQSFSTTQMIDDKGIPGAVVADDEVWIFSCGQDALTRLVSQDGVSFVLVDDTVVSVSPGIHCDPSPIRLLDGSYAMVFKHIRAQDMKQVRTPTTPPTP